MANNRIYIRCKGCGETLFLGKAGQKCFFWERYGDALPLSDQLNLFFSEHAYCMKQKAKYVPYDEKLFPMPVDFDGCMGAFDIVYENYFGTGIGDEGDDDD